MDHLIATLLTFIIALTITIVSSAQTGADEKNAQFFGGSGSSGAAIEKARLVRRYVPQFIGKREQGSTETELTNTHDINKEQEISDTKETENEFLELLRKYELYNINKELNEGDFENSSEDSAVHPDYFDDTDEYSNTIDDTASGTQEDKRYVPSLVGKRYQPRFVGKRYQPRFVGKRYQPMFVGKRYQPMFVGKRYQPMFVGKRHQPMFVGKRYQPMFVGKRYQPMFVGKRYQPMFVGKRYQPFFVGKKSKSIPMFVGKKDSDSFLEHSGNAEDTHPFLLEKRSISENAEKMSNAPDNLGEIKERRKRSMFDAGEEDRHNKRSWGPYEPWLEYPTYHLRIQTPVSKRRFVPPEFIGRRDAISSILSALKVLKYTRTEPRSASKRFQAPLFIGKRSMNTNQLFSDDYDLNPLSDSDFNSYPPTFDVIH